VGLLESGKKSVGCQHSSTGFKRGSNDSLAHPSSDLKISAFSGGSECVTLCRSGGTVSTAATRHCLLCGAILSAGLATQRLMKVLQACIADETLEPLFKLTMDPQAIWYIVFCNKIYIKIEMPLFIGKVTGEERI
jgi:hypothetical protein